jgi:hypothetical protein
MHVGVIGGTGHISTSIVRVMWLYSSGHTETRNSHSIRGVFDEPTHDEKVSCRI